MIQVGFKILVGRIPFFHDQILDFQNLGDFHVRSAPPATQILSYDCLLVFRTTCRVV